MVISILAILKAGCCYLPLDPSFPQERLSYMFRDSGAKVIITQRSLKDKFGYFTLASFVIIDSKNEIFKNYPASRPDIKPDPQSLAYLIYTSGSTGKPKGVRVPHQGVVNLISCMTRVPGISSDDILLAVVTLSFDMSVFELFLPLSNGATIVVAESKDIREGKNLIDLLEKYDITILQAAPSLYYVLLASGWKGKNNLRALCGGEALTSNMVSRILPNVAELWNCYGPTETTVYSTQTRITKPGEKIHIGKPLDNTRIYILDRYNQMLPAGVIGEIGIGGVGVTKGYINQPSLTSEKFITTDDGHLVYKTGDRGRFMKDGNIELFGRIDNQVKIRGIRIEPGEIEVQLSSIEGINESIIKLQKFDENDERLIAFLNVSAGFNMDAREINNRIRVKLPIYMIPSAYKIMKEFPRTSNGKIDRKALVFQIDETGSNGKDHLVHLTAAEKRIHEIWCKVLKTKDISLSDNFFEVGGNSLLAISVFSKIESEFNVSLGLRVFFDSPRIKDLGELIDIAKMRMVKSGKEKKEKADYKIVKGQV
jgi:amino acid adenylation domain-containing protein